MTGNIICADTWHADVVARRAARASQSKMHFTDRPSLSSGASHSGALHNTHACICVRREDEPVRSRKRDCELSRVYKWQNVTSPAKDAYSRLSYLPGNAISVLGARRNKESADPRQTANQRNFPNVYSRVYILSVLR